MSVDTELRRRALPELEDEREVDFGRYWSAISARWWLLAVGVAAGIIAGLLVAIDRSPSYEATTVVYLGQPFPPGGTQTFQSLPTQIALAQELVVARSTRRAIASRIGGIGPDRLVGSLSSEPVSPLRRGRVDQVAPLIRITAQRLPARKAVQATTAAAAMVVDEFSTYVDEKLETYERRLERAARELERVVERLRFAEEQQRDVLGDDSIPTAEKLIVLANLNNVIEFNETRRSNLEQSQLALRDSITLGREVERARVIEPASAQRQSPPSQRSAAAVGAAIGLILGALAAVLWEPLARRLRRGTA